MSALSGKIALITGGTKGIGKATALRLVEQGAKVAVSYGKDSKAADELVSQIGSDKALAVQADAGQLAGIAKLVKATVDKFGKIDILIPNAGWLTMKTFEKTEEADFDRAYNTNVKGPFFLVQNALPHMPKGSRIILLSTTQNFASTVSPPYLLYCSTKGAIDQMTRILAKDLAASKGISVNCVAPGPTDTDLFNEGKTQDMIKMIASLSPYNRIGKPEEIADAIAYLSGPGAAWVNGQTIKVNGGSSS